MAAAARTLSWPNATREIVNFIEQAAGIASANGNTSTSVSPANSSMRRQATEPAQRNQATEKVAP